MNWLGNVAITALCLFGPMVSATAGEVVDAEQELQLLSRGVTPPKRLDNSAFRVAVFSFEDPDGLGLGDALATLVGHEILTGSRVSSLGMLRYSGPLTPRSEEELGYFDKVDLLTRSQEPTVAMWGMVRRETDHIVIESYLQIPESTMARGLQIQLTLPTAMGNGKLRARLGADRLLLQRRQLPLIAVEQLQAAAVRLGELRAQPRGNAPVVARLPMQQVYYLKETRGDWVLIATSGSTGWVPRSGHCTDDCAVLLDPPRFVSELLAFIATRRPIQSAETLAPDAQQLRDEVLASTILDDMAPGVQDPQSHVNEAIRLLARWLPRQGDVAATAAAGGAGSANLRLLARMKGELWRARSFYARGGDPVKYDRLQLPLETVRTFAFEAADAILIDPNNVDLLNNLGVLYGALGDETRAMLANRLLKQATASSRQRLLPNP